jgi:flavin reductase (DIM6/NTAB) family NADH-FMN oxidoreductase RutF
MAQTIMPRPIAWILSENENGSCNLAPFSYFAPVCSRPPLIMVSIGCREDGTPKDSRANIVARREFVIHIPSWSELEPMNASSATLPPGVSEVEELGLELVDFEGFRLPRLKSSRVAFGCRLYEIKEIGSGPYAMILGEIEKVYLADAAVLDDDGKKIGIDPQALDPVARLGGIQYAELGQVVSLARPK